MYSAEEQLEFEKQLAFGDENEEMLRVFILKHWGYAIVHTSKLKNEEGKGGRLDLPAMCQRRRIPIPDFLCIKCVHSTKSFLNLPDQFFADLKTKRKADYYRNRSRWETGMDAKCRANYLLPEQELHVPVWVFHLIYPTSEAAMDAQRVPTDKRPAPTGLYGCPVAQKVNEFRGMVYWGIEEMVKLAPLEDILSVDKEVAA